MTDNTKRITLKLIAAQRERQAQRERATRKVFLGNFVYAEFMKGHVRLTDEDGCGRVLDTIMLNSEQFRKLVVEATR